MKIGLLGLLSIVFIVLKLTEVINWSWWLVLLPIYIIPAAFIVIFLLIIIVKKQTMKRTKINNNK